MTAKKRILIVDDEKSVTQMLQMLLETRGYEVNIAASGKEALNMAASHPDLILLDLVLPDVEGFEVCRQLREYKGTHDIPVIIVSVKYMFEDKVEGLYLGADDYLTKPFDFEELFARMEAVMRRSLLFNDNAGDRDEMIFELRRILKEERITPYYQPIFNLNPFHILGFEALSRPCNKNTVLSNPEKLFKAALQFGMYCELELMSWHKAIEKRPQGSFGGKLFLNCNPYLVESSLFYRVKSIFEKYKLEAKDVILEITERSAITDFNAFYERLRAYRDYGFGLAIDDVGGGYASLESIVQTNPTVVKIDNHLVLGVHKDSVKRSIIKFMSTFCKENKILSIAEGIECKEDLEVVRELGVDAVQGYLLCRPTPTPNISDISRDVYERLNIKCHV